MLIPAILCAGVLGACALQLSRRRSDRLIERAFAYDDRELQLTAVAVAVENGLERHARPLVAYVESGSDPVVLDAIRGAVRRRRAGPLLPPEPGGFERAQWWNVLHRWADGRLGPTATATLDPNVDTRQRGAPVPVPAPAPRRRRRSVGWIVLDLAVITAATCAIGLWCGAFSGFPKGSDAWGHISKVQLLVDNFPHINWNYAWYSGLPYFHGSYPPLYHAVLAVVSTTTGMSIPTTMVLVGAVSVVAIVLSVYALVGLLTGRRLPGLVAAALLLSSPGLWAHILDHGLYPRLLAMAFLGISLLSTTAYVLSRTRTRLEVAVVGLAGALGTHLFVGVLGVLLVTLVVAIAPQWRLADRFKRAGVLAGGAVLLDAFFYLPYALTPRTQKALGPDGNPAPLRSLFWPAGDKLVDSLPLLLLPLAVGLAACLVRALRTRPTTLEARLSQRLSSTTPAARRAVGHYDPTVLDPAAIERLLSAIDRGPGPDTGRVGRWWWRTSTLRVPIRVAIACVLVSFVCVGYAIAGNLGSFPYYISGIEPIDVLVYPSWLLAVGCGIALGCLLRSHRRHVAAGHAAVAVAVAVVCLALTLPRLPGAVRDTGWRADPYKPQVAALLPPEVDQRDFRLAATTDETSDWVNGRLAVPQIRGYQVQGVTKPDWQFWLEDTLQTPETTSGERDFLIDWYGIKWLYGGPGVAAARSFASSPETFDTLASTDFGVDYTTYRVREAAPILTATSATTALVVGREVDYDAFLRALAPANVNSQQVIPLRGRETIDDHSLDELRRFDVVVLYGAAARSSRAADRLLASYVHHGGGLVIEAAGSPSLAHAGWEVSPVTASQRQETSADWGFQPTPHPLTDGVDFGRFSPPSFGDTGSWITVASRGLRPWAMPLVTSKGESLVVGGQVGAGRVAWSGLNLPYHTADYHNPAESAFLGRMISSVAAKPAGPDHRFDARFVNAERRTVTVQPSATGVLLKENADAGWKATVDGRAASIYRAGPDFMYVPLAGSGRPATVVFSYRTSAVQWAGVAVSLAAVAGLVLFWLRLPRRRRGRPMTTEVRASPRM